MKIKTIIYFSLCIIVGAIILFSSMIFSLHNEISEANEKHATANAITKNVSEMRALTFEYIISPGDRATQQWLAHYKVLNNLLNRYPISTSQEKQLIAEIKASNNLLESTFTKLTTTNASQGELQTKLVGQLITRSQGMVSNSLLLAAITYEQTIAKLAQSNQLIMAITVMLFILCLGILLLFNRRILKPLTKLEKATTIISTGNLNYVVPVVGRDEIGHLGRSFNKMISQLQKLDEMKSEFLNVASHQLRTPLTTIRWNLESLLHQKHLPLEKTRTIIDDTHKKVLQLVALIGDFLTAYNIDQGKIFDNPKNISVTHTIKDILKDVTDEINLGDIAITIDGSPNIEAHVDPEKFASLIRHILLNAIIYNKDEGGTITITVREKNALVTITVSDNGIGIPEDAMPNIFSRFYRAKNAILTHPDGNGLGLFITKAFIERWKGTVTLTSTLNKGTSITLSLPNQKTRLNTE